jgi:hypothetical protein
MFDTHQKTPLPTFAPHPTPLVALRAFAEENAAALLNAADLLGGRRGATLAQCVLDGLAADGAPTRRTLLACDALLGLLMLEHVHDPSREEAARFAAIDPASACVEEICALADGLSDVLEACRASASSSRQANARKAAA